MDAALRALSVSDGDDIYQLLQQLPADENGFQNGMFGTSREQFARWLCHSAKAARGVGLADWQVPQTVYWLYVDGEPVGMGKLRHRLTDRLRREGGHIGYAIAPKARGQGYGTLILKLLTRRAAEMGISSALVTVRNDNLPSIRVALANGGQIEEITADRHLIWVPCPADGSV
ncbi:MAG: GNAT family N-acetyltransferase [Clostridiales bacterium]|nr:GNAT family N-acetyltransferase [Clostridiales bacterium]